MRLLSIQLLTIIIAALSSMPAYATPPTFRASGVKTVELRHEGASDRREVSVPSCVVCHLGQPETLTLDFDIIGGDTESLYYTFSHYDARWEPSDLMEMEYVDGINKVYGAETSRLSFNTTVAYIHYSVTISTEPLIASGNFIIEIHDATDDHLILCEPMWMTEDACGLGVRVDKESETQEMDIAVRWPSHGLQQPETQLTVCAWQNKRIDDMRYAEGLTFVRPDEITYQHLNEFRFCGGREWRWLDTRSIRQLGISDSRIDFIGDTYHYTQAPDERAKAYSYREDFDGGQWIETRDRKDDDAAVVADYAMAHFSFIPDDPTTLTSNDFYIIGDATGWQPSATNHLEPDGATMSVNGQQLVKQGLHNYLYVSRPKKRKRQAPQMIDTEGCYGITENDYHIAVYARRPGETYDHLVAFKTHNTLKSLNEFIN